MAGHQCKLKTLKRLSVTLLLTITASGCSDQPHKKIEHSIQGVFDAEISREGDLALIASIHHGGSLWSLDREERLYNWNHSEDFSQLTHVSLSPNGLVGITAQNQDLAFWNATTGESFRFWKASAHITSTAISLNNYIALVGLSNGDALIVDIRDADSTRSLQHNAKITSVSISNSGRYGLTGSKDGLARLWNLQTGKELRSWKHKYHVNQVKLSPKATYSFTAGQHDKYYLWDSKSGQRLLEKNNRASSITAVNFSRDEAYLVIGNSIREIKLYQLNPSKLLKTWRIPIKTSFRPTGISPISLTYIPEKKMVICISSDGYSYFYKYE